MALSLMLGEAGYTPEEITTSAEVTIEKKGEGFAITGIVLNTEATIPDISEEEFQKQANNAKSGCPVSQELV